MIGQTISHYKIIEKLGEGGMGVVYKAQDMNLNRSVALKFLPHHLTEHEPERSRFLQEAQAAALLNHPNICVIYGIHEHDGQQFIEMEYVDGGTLRHKVPLQKLSDVLTYAIQIGDALHEAHSKGIVHRDIKADNIMVNSKNQIKVMDFGLAKLKGSMKLTRTSSTVGTLAYMAPEQIQGGEVDARSDIFSFAVVLFEMLTGHLPFRGEHDAAMMYSIMNEEPESVEKYRKDISPVLVNLIQRALEKSPDDRYQNVQEIVIELRRLQKQSSKVVRPSMASMPVTTSVQQSQSNEVPPPQPVLQKTLGRKNSVMIGGIALLVVVIVLYYVLSKKESTETRPLQLSYSQLTDQAGVEESPDISPDGNYIVFVKTVPGNSDIHLQRIGGGNPINLTQESKVDDREPAFSPDGQQIVFRSERSGGGIFLMGATGENVRRLTDFGNEPVWSPDGKEIVFATEGIRDAYGRNTTSQLWKITIATGEKIKIFDGDAVQPQWSPHGYRIAYWGLPKGTGQRDIWTMPAEGGEPIAVTSDAAVDWNPVWSPDGGFLYFSSDRGGSVNLWRVPIDEQTGKSLGEPQPITTPSRWSGSLRISRDGNRLVYVARDEQANIFRLGFDPVTESVTGVPTAVTKGTKLFISPNPSPDNEWVAFRSAGTQEDIYISRKDGSGLRQLTNDIYKDRGPSWSPDGKKITFYAARSGRYEIWSINPDGSGLEQMTKTIGGSPNYPFWFSDGKRIACSNSGEEGTMLFDLSKPLNERLVEVLPPASNDGKKFYVNSVSPNSEWLAGDILRSDGNPIPGVALYSMSNKTYQTITDSGNVPLWLNDNLRLLYQKNGKLFIVNYRTKKSHEVKTPESFFLVGDYRISNDNRVVYYQVFSSESDIWQVTMK